jgi:alpha-D-xyloside xylohydrolase
MKTSGPSGSWLIVLLMAVVSFGCGSDSTNADVVDVGRDVPAETAADALPDLETPSDVVVDVGSEVPVDLPADGLADVPGELPPDAVDPGPLTVDLTLGGYGLHLDRTAMTLTLLRGQESLLVFERDGIQFGRVDEIDDSISYDPIPLAEGNSSYDPPYGLAFLDITAMAFGASDATHADVRLSYGTAKAATLTIEVVTEGRIKLFLKPDAAGDAVAYVRLRPKVDSTEAFYGLGAYLDQVNHRGKVRAMQLEIADKLESSYNEAHVPVPLVIGTRGWGLFVASRYPGSFDLGVASADHVEATFGTGGDTGKGVEFHLFAAEKPIDITRHYYGVTGNPLLPARWALGPLIWRDEIAGQAAVVEDLETIRDLDLPTTAYWIDRPYANGVNSFDFHKVNYPDPQAMIDRAHALGLRMALWHTPYVTESTESCPETETLLAEAVTNGYHPPTVGLKLNKWGAPIDFTNPDAYMWWQALIRRYTDMGIEGFKMDYGEDVVPGLLGMRNVWKFHDGTDERTMHSLYRMYYHQIYAQTLPESGGFLLCRAGTWGDQANVSVIWPGDLDANCALHGDPIPGDGAGMSYVGGLPASLAYGLNLGPSGFPFYGSDTGGYRASPPDRETFIRWYQQTALSTVMQVGTSSNNVAWEFTNPDGSPDTELLDNYRVYTRLHLRLFAYEWTYAQALAVTGRAIMRPLGLVYPEIGLHPSDTYMFGDDLLVAPVVAKDQRQREVILPPGTWIQWWTGVQYEGGQTVTMDAPLLQLQLFLRQSGIVPMLRPTINAMAPITDDSGRIDSYDTTPGVLWARVFAGAASTFKVFDGTVLDQEGTATSISLGYKAGDEFSLGAMFEVVGVQSVPSEVTESASEMGEVQDLMALQAVSSGWTYDAATKTLFVKVASGDHAVQAILPVL